MGGVYEKLGDLLSRKISEEENLTEEEISVANKYPLEEKKSDSAENLIEEKIIINNKNSFSLSNKIKLEDILKTKNETPVGEVLQADQFKEETPVKIINADITFSSRENSEK